MMNLFPTANTAFAKLLTQTLKLATEKSSIQSFDSKDLERCLKADKRMVIGTTVIRDPNVSNLGSVILQNCLKRSPCPDVREKAKIGALLLVVTPEMANNPEVSQHMDAAISYVGGRSETLFSGVYVRDNLPGLIAITLMGGLEQ